MGKLEKYGFYSKSDSTKEIIAKCDANSQEQAILIFIAMKNLNLNTFLELYVVERI